MKIICINNSLREWDRDYYNHRLENITIGKTYDAKNVSGLSNPWNSPVVEEDLTPLDVVDLYITNDMGKLDWLPYYLFEPLDINREKKLNKLGI